MPARVSWIPLLGVLLAGCGSPPPEVAQLQHAVVARAASVNVGTSVAFRFAGRRGAGDVQVYRLPGLVPADWRFNAPSLVAASVVGFDGDDDELLVLTPDHDLVAVDLGGGPPRTVDSNVALATLGPRGTAVLALQDSTIAAMNGRKATEVGTARGAITGLWGTNGSRVVIEVRSDSGHWLEQVQSSAQKPERRRIPDGPVDVARWGDAAAVATDSGIAVLDLLHPGADEFIRLAETPLTAIFSPAGNRIYAATADGHLVVLDRFDRSVISKLTLPGPARALRNGPYGRVLLARPRTGDSAWVASMIDDRPVQTISTAWDDDLPAVAPDGTILTRVGKDVIALSADSLKTVGRVAGGASDRWLTAPWDPRRPPLVVAETAARSTAAATQQAGTRMYVQVSSTSNPSWANNLAGDLRQAGLKATVLAPADSDQMYRVVIGPYATREEAEATGRKLGMPFWIYTQTPPAAPTP